MHFLLFHSVHVRSFNILAQVGDELATDGFHRFLTHLILLSGEFVSHDAIKVQIIDPATCQPPTINNGKLS